MMGVRSLVLVVVVAACGEVKNNPRIHIPIFGNGDIDSPEKAKEYGERYVPGVPRRYSAKAKNALAEAA